LSEAIIVPWKTKKSVVEKAGRNIIRNIVGNIEESLVAVIVGMYPVGTRWQPVLKLNHPANNLFC